jgi:hypothetical protein
MYPLGGGKDLETAASFASKKTNVPTTSSTITVPKVGISSPFLKNPIKISIPASATTLAKPVVVKSIGSVTTPDGKLIKFIPPKVNTANNRVPPEERFKSSGPGKNQTIINMYQCLSICPCAILSCLLSPPLKNFVKHSSIPWSAVWNIFPRQFSLDNSTK